jgi:hypothetical protein
MLCTEPRIFCASYRNASRRGISMRLIGVSIRVAEDEHEAVCDSLSKMLETIREAHPGVVYEMAEEVRSSDPALSPDTDGQ